MSHNFCWVSENVGAKGPQRPSAIVSMPATALYIVTHVGWDVKLHSLNTVMYHDLIVHHHRIGDIMSVYMIR